MHDTSFNTLLRRKAQAVNYALKQIIDFQEVNKELKDALNYTIQTPGKRIRSVLVQQRYSGKRSNRYAEILSGKMG